MISLNVSHHQISSSLHEARSLGSVALRKAENMEGGLHFNVFTVDFNEELVALYGGSLLRQTHFLHESIKAILRLYKVRPQISSARHSRWRILLVEYYFSVEATLQTHFITLYI